MPIDDEILVHLVSNVSFLCLEKTRTLITAGGLSMVFEVRVCIFFDFILRNELLDCILIRLYVAYI